MTVIADIREGLRANLAPITGCQVSAYLLSNPTPPVLMIYPGPTDYDLAMGRGLDRWTLTIQALTGLVTDIGAQQLLDQWRASTGARSVKAQAESDKTLGGAASSTRVISVTGDSIYTPDGKGPYLGCEWTVEVLATGT